MASPPRKRAPSRSKSPKSKSPKSKSPSRKSPTRMQSPSKSTATKGMKEDSKPMKGEKASSRKEVSSLESGIAACSYIGVSMMMTLLNKQIISKTKFPGTNFLLFCECLVTVLLVLWADVVAKWQGKREKENEKKSGPSGYQPFDMRYVKYLLPCTLAKAGNMYFSFLSMKYTSLPVYNVLKRMSPISALFIDSFVRSKTYPPLAKVGMFCLFCGAIVTGTGDLDFDILGYSCALAAVFGQSSYLVLAARARDGLPDIRDADVLFYTGFYNMFLFLPLMLPEFENIQMFLATTADDPLYLAAVFFLYIFQGMLLNYVTFWCCSVTSPVTTGMCGNFKGLLSSLVSVFMFSVNLSIVGWIGFSLNSCGGMLYAYSTAKEKQKKLKSK